jgi:hypothetical protein
MFPSDLNALKQLSENLTKNAAIYTYIYKVDLSLTT